MKALHVRRDLSVLALLALFACGKGAGEPPSAPRAVPAAAPIPPASLDPLGPRPPAPSPPAYAPPVPTVSKLANGMTVWHLERHEVPFVAVGFVVPYGSASDPAGKDGLAYLTTGLLDEGAGVHDALELARVLERNGATIQTAAHEDYSVVSLVGLKRTLDQTLPIFADVLQRPRFEPKDFKRVKDLWLNALKARASDPEDVADVTGVRALFGENHPYGHPTEGNLKPATSLTVLDVQAFYKAHFRPDAATLVVAGDVTRAELDGLFGRSLGTWAAPKAPLPALPTLPEPAPRSRIVLVDRPDAPQSVITLLRAGTSASAQEAPLLSRANVALGGAFTSRLNQTLREDRGWTYGARSRFSFARGRGLFSAGCSVVTEKTAEGLGVLVKEVDAYAASGPSADEAEKTRLTLRADAVETYEKLEGLLGRLLRNAGVGLPVDQDSRSALVRDAAKREDLFAAIQPALAKEGRVFVVVGAKAKIAADVAKLGLGPIEEVAFVP